ncbi:hypothetical protein KU6B_48020 [Mameliella alba]|uniref:hypothetical protein n=1 Tax=Mameliella alba TaxID=561184 RepID=UPI0013E45FF3|nr:hypothetical protein [Mameliella alba]BBU58537.1 hypothetical protein KU6B_48020 [Mameliella alba]
MFDSLRKVSIAIESISWLSVALGAVLAALSLGERDIFPGIILGGAVAGSGLLLVLLAQTSRVIVFIAEVLHAERMAVPAPGGGKSPGRVIETRFGRELRDIGGGRYWVEGEVFNSANAARDALRAKSAE